MDLEVEEHVVRSFDGTEIAHHTVGEGAPILLANGLGGSWRAWTHQIRHFRDRYRFLSWDYRGLYASGSPRDRAAISVAHHADDAIAVMDARGIEQTAIFGWSMGVQVALEVCRRVPERVTHLVLINGVAGSPWESAFDTPALGALIPGVLGLVRRMPRLTQGVTEWVVSQPTTVDWAKRLGLAANTLDDAIFAQLARSFAGLDMDLYMHTLSLLGEHDARDLLAALEVPVLVVAGDRDLLTPRSAAEAMVRSIPDAELLVVRGGTHYVAVEYPELVNRRVDEFFRDHGHG